MEFHRERFLAHCYFCYSDCVQSSTRLFADDCILYRRIQNQHDSAILQDDLNKLAAWEKKWGMSFHPDKCSAIRISRSRKSAPMNYTLKGRVLQNEDYTRYLGVELQSNLSWNRHIDQTVKKANSMLGFLRRNLRVSNESTKTSAYRSMVRPLLECCSTVWSPYTQEHIQKIEMVQRRAARYVTNRYHNLIRHQKTPNVFKCILQVTQRRPFRVDCKLLHTFELLFFYKPK